MKEDPGILVPDGNGIVVTNLCRTDQWHIVRHKATVRTLAVQEQFVAPQSLLECRAHEGITRTGVGEDGQVNPEDGQVQEDRKDNKRDGSRSEVLPEIFLAPQISPLN